MSAIRTKVYFERAALVYQILKFCGITAIFSVGLSAGISADGSTGLVLFIAALTLGSLIFTIHYIIQLVKTKPVLIIQENGFHFEERFIEWENVEKVEVARARGESTMCVYFVAEYSPLPLPINVTNWKISDEDLSKLMNTALQAHQVRFPKADSTPKSAF